MTLDDYEAALRRGVARRNALFAVAAVILGSLLFAAFLAILTVGAVMVVRVLSP